MCDPISIGLAVVSTTLSVAGQIKQSKAMARAINAQSEQQADEIRDRASAEMFDRSVETFERIGMQRVAGASRGLNDASRSLQMANDAILFDYDFDNARTMLNAENAQKARLSETRSQLARASRPTLLGAGLQIATAGVKAAHDAGAFEKGK
jgi:hypothetical protein